MKAKERLLEEGFIKFAVEKAIAKARDKITGQYGNWLPTVYQGRLYSCAKELLEKADTLEEM